MKKKDNDKINMFEDLDEEIMDTKNIDSSDSNENDFEDFDMNLQPKLGKWKSWMLKRKLKSKAKKEERAIEKKEERAIDKKENEEISNKSITKKDLILSGLFLSLQLPIAVAAITLTVMFPYPLVCVLMGSLLVLGIVSVKEGIKDIIHKYKEYRKENPKVKKKKEKKQKKEKKPKKQNGKKLGLGKRIKNFFSKSKNKSDDSSQLPEIQPEEPTPNSIDNDQTSENKVVPASKDNEVALRYSLDQNGSGINTVDLSNISTNPGLDVNVQHFIVNKDNKLMQELVEQYIEKSTGIPAMYADRVINNEEKRVYMLTR